MLEFQYVLLRIATILIVVSFTSLYTPLTRRRIRNVKNKQEEAHLESGGKGKKECHRMALVVIFLFISYACM
jgi:hypothetical protein